MKNVIYTALCLITLISSFSGTVNAGSCGIREDINGDDKTGMEEAVYALQVVAGIKPQHSNTNLQKAICALQTVTGLYPEYLVITIEDFVGVGAVTFEELEPSEITGTATNEVLTFELPAFDPECSDWNVSVTSKLNESLKSMDLEASGTFCGEGGGELDVLSVALNKVKSE